jgi:hypothetical protein
VLIRDDSVSDKRASLHNERHWVPAPTQAFEGRLFAGTTINEIVVAEFFRYLMRRKSTKPFAVCAVFKKSICPNHRTRIGGDQNQNAKCDAVPSEHIEIMRADVTQQPAYAEIRGDKC